MPPWGRPPGAGGARLGRNGLPYGARLQELQDSDEDDFAAMGVRGQGGVFLDPMVRKGATRRAISDDALYYDGIDTRWDPRGEIDHDNLAYEDDYYGVRLSADDDELLVQRAIDRIRIARARGQPNVNLSHEELEALARPRLQQISNSADPAPARPSSKGRSSSSSNSTNTGIRSKKSNARLSFFSSSPRSSRPRSGKSDSKRRNSSAHDSELPPTAPPPGFRIPGAGAAPLGYASRPPSRPDSRSASGGYDAALRDYVRPNSRDSIGLTPAEEAEYLTRRANRSRSGSGAAPSYSQPPYPTYAFERERGRPGDADPFLYQTGGPPPGLYAGSSASSSPSSQRRTMSSHNSDGFSYTAVPRRVPVPTGAALTAGSSRLAAVAGLGQGSASDPALGYRSTSGYRGRDLEVEVEYEPLGTSGSSGESDGAQQGVRIGGAEFDAGAGVRDRVRELEREANASGRSGSGSGSGSGNGRRRKGKRK